MITDKTRPYIACNLKKQAKARIWKLLCDQVEKKEMVIGSVTDAMRKWGTGHPAVENWLGGLTKATWEKKWKEIEIDENTRMAIITLTQAFSIVHKLTNAKNKKAILSVVEFLWKIF